MISMTPTLLRHKGCRVSEYYQQTRVAKMQVDGSLVFVRVARWYISKTKIPIWGKFWRALE
jgi:hypothetical protein